MLCLQSTDTGPSSDASVIGPYPLHTDRHLTSGGGQLRFAASSGQFSKNVRCNENLRMWRSNGSSRASPIGCSLHTAELSSEPSGLKVNKNRLVRTGPGSRAKQCEIVHFRRSLQLPSGPWHEALGPRVDHPSCSEPGNQTSCRHEGRRRQRRGSRLAGSIVPLATSVAKSERRRLWLRAWRRNI